VEQEEQVYKTQSLDRPPITGVEEVVEVVFPRGLRLPVAVGEVTAAAPVPQAMQLHQVGPPIGEVGVVAAD